jgi:hypothetical protein
MLVKNIIEKIDGILRRYLGLTHEEVKPQTVEIIGDQLIITHSSSSKRHSTKETWNEFSHTNIEQIDKENLEKLGIAAGKAIAKNLIISFEVTPVEHTYEK